MTDLHIHSLYSDGDDDLKTLIKKVEDAKINIFSITDHDDFSASTEILNNNYISKNVKFVSGIEFSTILDDYKMHLLGYNFNVKNKQFNTAVTNLKNKRLKRVYALCKYLKKQFNIVIPKKELDKVFSKNSSVGKPHIAGILITMGLASSVDDAFKKYLKAFSLDGEKIITTTAIKLILNAGGIPVLAHPKEIMNEYNLNYSDIELLICRLKQNGLMGIEVFYTTHTKEDVTAFLNIANKHNLLVSAGSDYHGEKTKPNIKLGKISKTIPNKDITILNKL